MERKKNKQPKLHVRKGDTVKVISGNSKGKEAKVLEVIPKKNKAIVEGVNVVTKHIKPSAANPEGGIEKTADAPRPDIDVIVRYADKDILMSGWAKGQNQYLKNKAAMMDVAFGEGNIILFGFKPQFRGQPRASYKLLFNSILSGAEN